ncbi:hypothetical protein FV139_12655 [Parahaliea maris]|uniref:Peptidase M28 domain-containing protein n=1 Tax=Parahaliea maris TaxID=2716870 RepID=A0A5C8ZYK5_9GAMM|nr:hypothetical protein [Parahaliea maris]TXS92814.1 hypothetical protein FV139_12655 [Parahaliea maris]
MYRIIIRLMQVSVAYIGIVYSFMTAAATGGDCLQNFCAPLTISREQVVAWHQAKDQFGPTFAGSSGWNSYLALIEREAGQLGMVDLRRNTFRYNRWHTSEWPDRSGWSLRIGDRQIDVANYGANSGDTGPNGVRAELVVVTGEEFEALPDPAVLAGKIIVLQVAPTDFQRQVPDWLYAPADYPYRAGQWLKVEDTVSSSTASQLFAANLQGKLPFPEPHYLKRIKQTKAAGVVLIFDMADERVRGLYSFPVPAIYNVPTLYLGREAGAEVISAAKSARHGILVLDAQEESTQAYQLAAVLPGRNYGSDDDEIILMISHTDGPSISQENGPLGLLSILHYFSRIDQRHRDKSLMLFLDSRHFIPDREAALPGYDIQRVLGAGGALAPAHGRLVASVHLEHLGQVEYAERNGRYLPTGQMENGGFYVTPYRDLVALSRGALEQHQPRNQVLRATDVPGVHGQSQGHWFGLGHHPRRLGIEVIASNMVSMGAYWSSAAGIDYFDPDQFMRQVNTMTGITAGLIRGDIKTILAHPLPEPEN